MPVFDIFTAGPLWAMATDGIPVKLLKLSDSSAIASSFLFIKTSFSMAVIEPSPNPALYGQDLSDGTHCRTQWP